jgi:chromosome segregation ATPase
MGLVAFLDQWQNVLAPGGATAVVATAVGWLFKHQLDRKKHADSMEIENKKLQIEERARIVKASANQRVEQAESEISDLKKQITSLTISAAEGASSEFADLFAGIVKRFDRELLYVKGLINRLKERADKILEELRAERSQEKRFQDKEHRLESEYEGLLEGIAHCVEVKKNLQKQRQEAERIWKDIAKGRWDELLELEELRRLEARLKYLKGGDVLRVVRAEMRREIARRGKAHAEAMAKIASTRHAHAKASAHSALPIPDPE